MSERYAIIHSCSQRGCQTKRGTMQNPYENVIVSETYLGLIYGTHEVLVQKWSDKVFTATVTYRDWDGSECAVIDSETKTWEHMPCMSEIEELLEQIIEDQVGLLESSTL